MKGTENRLSGTEKVYDKINRNPQVTPDIVMKT